MTLSLRREGVLGAVVGAAVGSTRVRGDDFRVDLALVVDVLQGRASDVGDDPHTAAVVDGCLAGARDGIQAIPSRVTTYLHGDVITATGSRRCRLEDLHEVGDRLLGRTPRPLAPLDPPRGPVEVAPGLHAANLAGATRVPTDWAVVSLCRVGDRFLGHAHRRAIYLVDQPTGHNDALGTALDDAVGSIDELLADGRRVVVHCHAGASRTGFVLKAWKMHADGVSHAEAHRWLERIWPAYDPHNRTFWQHLESRS